MDKNRELMDRAYKKIEEMKDLAKDDYHRLKYHIMPPTGLLNDPNGFTQYNGEYHLFYQFHPYDTKHGLKFWGHYKSKDLINWETLPIALAPDKYYDSHGCYSGSAIDDNGVLTLIYTGNVKDDEGNRETYQCLAKSSNGIEFEKDPSNPVMINQPKGYTRHFRDPKVWKQKDIWYMVIGTQTIDNEGRVLLFSSKDLINWNLIGEVSGSNINGLGYFGYMWECPDLFNLEGKDVLIVSPQGLRPKGSLYNNIYQSGYFLGELDYISGKLNHGEFTELDRGFEYYAPQTTLDSQGRRILFAWMGLPEEEDHPTVKYGWIHAMTMPRVLSLKGGKVIQKPIEEMKNFRKNQVLYRNTSINGEKEFAGVSGDVFEMLIELDLEDVEKFGIKLRVSLEKNEESILSYDKKTNTITLDRNNSGIGYKGVRRCKLSNGLKTINIFSDTSSLEIFINDGEEVFTSRIYPDKNSKKIIFYSKGGVTNIKKLYKWDIDV